jgi:WD40 repeat protein
VLLRTISGQSKGALSVAFAPDAQTLASGGGDQSMKLWRVADGPLLKTLASHRGRVLTVRFAPDGQTRLLSYNPAALTEPLHVEKL